MEQSEQNRTEEATPFKLKRAREKGTVARGMDLGFFGVLIGACGFAWAQGETLWGQISDASRRALASAPDAAGGAGLMTAIGHAFTAVAAPLGWLVLTVFATVLALELLQTGFVFSAVPLKPDWNRLNPGQGLKRVFSLRTLIETAKAALKLSVYVAVTAGVIMAALALIPTLSDGTRLAAAAQDLGLRLVGGFLLASLLFVALDQIISRRDFRKRMRMSRREVKREHRDREGDPRLKQKRKQLHAEFASQGESLRGVRGADLLITNPTHYAVALKYEPEVMDAPRVVARGSHGLAQRLKKLAFIYGVPTLVDPPLARALYRTAALRQPIPEAQFRAVADLYLQLRARRASA